MERDVVMRDRVGRDVTERDSLRDPGHSIGPGWPRAFSASCNTTQS
jgi:hypothetical protein